jgi:hypothetical protein
MTSVSDILGYAWDKDAVNLKSALDDVLTSRIADQIDAIKVDVASSMFGATNGEEMTEQDSQEPEELDSDEGAYDENV